MLISYKWLKEYVDITKTPKELSRLLTMAGVAVVEMHEKSGDTILELEITSNRPDLLSMIGVAREVAAIVGGKVKTPKDFILAEAAPKEPSIVKIEDKTLCPKYTGRIIKGVTIKDSPAWLSERLIAIDQRPVNNVVDITNFCLFESAHPLHAFDLDKLSGGVIIVRRAKKDEKIVTIDGVERKLDESVLVIADKEKPVAIAGIMGGLYTEVSANTKNILLESAYFDPISTRRTSRKLGLSSEASYRFERRVSFDGVVATSNRASSLIAELAGGHLEEYYRAGELKAANKEITLRYDRIKKVLGIDIDEKRVEEIITGLGCTIHDRTKNGLLCAATQERPDLKEEVDLIEEVARIHGYDKISTTIPVIVDQPDRLTPQIEIEKLLRNDLTAMGLSEIITYSLISRKLLSSAGIADGKEVIEILNPLTSEQDLMRPDLATGMLSTVMRNLNHKNNDLALFEIGNIYKKAGEDKFSEEKALSIGLAGNRSAGWMNGDELATFFDLKGILETIFKNLGIKNYSFERSDLPLFARGRQAKVLIGNDEIGSIGEVSAKIAANFDIKATKLFFAEIRLKKVIEASVLKKRFSELPRFPSVVRDLSIVIEKATPCVELLLSMKKSGGAILKEITLVDRYIGKQIPEGKAGYTFRLEFQNPAKTLEENEINSLFSDILNNLSKNFKATLR